MSRTHQETAAYRSGKCSAADHAGIRFSVLPGRIRAGKHYRKLKRLTNKKYKIWEDVLPYVLEVVIGKRNNWSCYIKTKASFLNRARSFA